MSALLVSSQLLSPEDYLAWELLNEERHEYIAGVVYAMAGASAAHNAISLNISGTLYNHLRAKPCQPFNSDMKLRLNFGADTVFYYPDAMVVCDPADDATYYRTRPVLIIEVLSPQTARVDQREKFLAYRTIPSVEVYGLVDQSRCHVTVYRRATDWKPEILTDPADLLTVPAIDWSIPLRDLYERTPFAG